MVYSGALIGCLTPGYKKKPVAKAPETTGRKPKFPIEEEEKIMRRYAMGEPVQKIAEDYHMSRSGINYHLDRVRIRERKKRKSGQ